MSSFSLASFQVFRLPSCSHLRQPVAVRSGNNHSRLLGSVVVLNHFLMTFSNETTVHHNVDCGEPICLVPESHTKCIANAPSRANLSRSNFQIQLPLQPCMAAYEAMFPDDSFCVGIASFPSAGICFCLAMVDSETRLTVVTIALLPILMCLLYNSFLTIESYHYIRGLYSH